MSVRAATTPSARRTRASAAGRARRPARPRRRRAPRPPRRASTPDVRRALDQAIDHVRRFAETQRPAIDPDHDPPRHRDRAPLDPAGLGRRLRPGRVRAVPVVAGHDRRPGTGRRRRARRRRLAGRPRRARHTPCCSARPACSRSTPSSWPVAPRPIGALAYGLPEAGLAPVDRIVGPGQRLGHGREDRGLRRGRHRPAGRALGGHGPRRAAGRSPSRGRGPDHPGRARPGLAGHPRHDGRRVRRRRRARGRRPARERGPTRHPRARAARPRPDRAGAGPRCRRSTSSTPTRRSTSRSTSSRSSRPSPGCATPARCSSARGRPSRPATTRRAPTTCCRPAGSRAAPAACPWRPTASSSRSSASPARAWPRSGTRSARWPRRRACWRTATRSRSASREDAAMSPTPVTFASPTAPSTLQLGGHRRGGRRALRRPDRAGSSGST